MKLRHLVPWNWGKDKVMVRRDEHNPFTTLQAEMNDMFDDFFGNFGRSRGFNHLLPFRYESDLPGGYVSPRINVSESDSEILVSAELPGLDEKDVEVHLADDTLTIEGEKKIEKEEKKKDCYHVERSYGSFCRTVPLYADIDREKVDASFKNGVLTVTLPKTEEARRHVKRIEVNKG